MEIECKVCHTTENWSVKDSKFNHSTTEFELIGQHKDVNCSSCHNTLIFDEVESDCQSCHVDMHENSVGFDCERCHTPNSWVVSDIEEMHRMSRFPLLGSHKVADCRECHVSNSLLNFEPQGAECSDCHIENYLATTSPNHVISNYSTNCEECHDLNSISWSGAGIVHDFFPLTGGHNISDCYSCHDPNGFEGLSQECSSCHTDDFNNTTNPSHVALGFSTDCETCHTINGWQPATFDHDTRFFPIYSGEHSGEWDDCSDCHTNSSDYGIFSCLTCHEHNQTDMNEEHSGINGYVYESTACFACHPNGSKDESFSHTTAFPLIGSHANAVCSDCHTSSYSNTSSECISCHQSSFENSQNPNHQTLALSEQCELCHGATDWVPSTFNHTTTGFELLGSHANVNCSDCHAEDVSLAVQDCFSCHENEYASIQSHVTQNYPKECEMCHNSVTWIETTFDHNTTNFPLTGAHLNSDCNSCHLSGFTGISTECSSCHQTDFDNAVNPNHQAAGISLRCEECHETTNWVPSTFNHITTGFELLGRHAEVDCSDCHAGSTSDAIQECFSCHENEFNNAQDHLTQNYPKECEICHNSVTWIETTFDHNTTNFPLTGAHINSECSDCHASGYSNISTECSSCHQTDFDNSTNPSHQTLGLSLECTVCHTTNPGWEPAEFPEHNSYYQLLGAHATISNNCFDCHNGDYNNTPTECFGCHETDYNNTTNPPHTASEFPTNCEECHSENAWTPATFDHDARFFPIYSGEHKDEWNECSDCHTTQNNYAIFSCIDCHEHNQTDMNEEHSGVDEYVYESNACFACHPNGSKDGSFSHALTFPLIGSHSNLPCVDCHVTTYSNTSTECVACHLSSFDNSQNPNHITLELSEQCELCHEATDWNLSTFKHSVTGFELLGNHANVDCASCHTVGVSNAVQECFSCHENEYNSTPSHLAQNYPKECEMCHNSVIWIETTFDHNTTNFPLTGAHINSDCSDCHSAGYTGISTDCSSCHQIDFDNSTNPSHQSLGLSTDCSACHTTNLGWAPAEFQEHNNYFQLLGAHATIANNCVDCHNNDYNNTPKDCIGCHETDYNNTNNPSHSAAQFSTTCEECHSVDAWTPATFDHDGRFFPIYSGEHKDEWTECSDCHTTQNNFAQFSCTDCHEHNQTDMNSEHSGINGYVYESTACYECHPTGNKEGGFSHTQTFLLIGSHANLLCSDCHVTTYSNTSTECLSCHQANFDNSTDPNHKAVGISEQCELCHEAINWVPSTFNHSTTGFELIGSHETVDCASCHEGSTSNAVQECVSCHRTNFDNSTDPNHKAVGISEQCELCHKTTNWVPSTFNHSTTGFELIGSHETVDCASCHEGSTSNAVQECFSCHESKYNAVLSHTSQSYPKECEMCHNTVTWIETSFDHSTTNFPLTGAHINTDCNACHTSGYTGTSAECLSCHQANFDNSINPNHKAVGISVQCEICHTTTKWVPSTFNHATTGFELLGSHETVDCVSCHEGSTSNAVQECISCHRTNFDNSTDPNHKAVGISEQCELCHEVTNWIPSTFNHTNTGFELLGSHETVDCVSCHEGSTSNAVQECFSCHESEYNAVLSHTSQSYPKECEMCHNTVTWIETTFDHSTTNFPLTGAHINSDCSACHSSGYSGTSTDCISCHQTEFDNSTNPNHQSLGLSTDCSACHTTNPAWEPAEFPDHDSYFQLLGAHSTIANNCADCHDGNYNNTPTECFGCHETDYINTTNPSHSAAQFPTNCEECHTVSSFTPSTFDHDGKYFPIYSGKHNEEWNQCSDCHTTANNYSIFSCVDCHEHNRTDTDADHSEVTNYIYESTACFDCHPTGNEDGVGTEKFKIKSVH